MACLGRVTMDNSNTIIAVLIVAIMIGAIWALNMDSDDSDETTSVPQREPIVYGPVVDDYQTYYDDIRNFTDFDTDFWTDNGSIEFTVLNYRNWTIFDRDEGGNCCEHYLATTKEGWIVNLGGEYPVWSEDRGHTWQTYVPTITDQDTSCRSPIHNIPGGEGLGEGSVVQATNGDLIAMSWYPYPNYDGKVDRFYAYLYDAASDEWSWCQNNVHEPFYDRSWQVEVKGPITRDANGLSGNWPWASIVISNYWHQSINEGGTISVDGINYDRLDFPGRNGNPNPVTFDLNFTDLGVEWDYAMPHREMRAIPLPGEENGGPAGVLFPRYFNDGSNAWLDTELRWHKHTVTNGTEIPSEYLWLDSSGTLHSLDRESDSNGLWHRTSTDGGNNWTLVMNYTWPTAQRIDEWEFQVDGSLKLANVFMRVQEQDDLCPAGSSPCDRDLLFQVRDYEEWPAPYNVVFLGLGDKDSTSGAGNDIRFDFASLAILPDGGAVVAYHDSTDEDPLFAVEVMLPEEYPAI